MRRDFVAMIGAAVVSGHDMSPASTVGREEAAGRGTYPASTVRRGEEAGRAGACEKRHGRLFSGATRGTWTWADVHLGRCRR